MYGMRYPAAVILAHEITTKKKKKKNDDQGWECGSVGKKKKKKKKKSPETNVENMRSDDDAVRCCGCLFPNDRTHGGCGEVVGCLCFVFGVSN